MSADRSPGDGRQRRRIQLGDVAHGEETAIVELLGCHPTHTPQLLHWQWMEKLELPVRVDDEEPVGLADTAGDLCQELRPRDTDRDRQSDLARHVDPQSRGDLGRCSREAQQAADIEKRLVDRDALDQRCHVIEDLEHCLARCGVGPESRVDEDQVGTQPFRFVPGHRRVDAESFCLVARRKNDAAPADRHSFALQGRVVALFDGGVERVEVGMENRCVFPRRRT